MIFIGGISNLLPIKSVLIFFTLLSSVAVGAVIRVADLRALIIVGATIRIGATTIVKATVA